MFSTMSARLSRCWILTVLMTVMPASSRSWTSCQRFSYFEPGALVWASSSTRATAGCRWMTASVSISSTVTPLYGIFLRGTVSRLAASSAVLGRPCVSRKPMTTSVPRSLRRCSSSRALYVLPTPGAMPRYTRRRPRAPAPASRRTRSSISSAVGRPSERRASGRCSVTYPLNASCQELHVTQEHQGSMQLLPVQGQIELEHVHPWLAEHEQRAALGVLIDQAAYLVLRKVARLRYACGLDQRVRRTDIRIQS